MTLLLILAAAILVAHVTPGYRTRATAKPKRRGNAANRRPVFGADWREPDA